MNPILITGPGRSGTTLLMGILSQSPQICVAELIPYETKLLSYYAAAYRTLTAPADPVRSMHPDRLGSSDRSVGFNPFNDDMYNSVFQNKSSAVDFFKNFVPEKVMATLSQLVVEYYTRLSMDQDKASAIYFAEKSSDIAPLPRMFTRLAFPRIREVVLYRDPRDLYCSRKSFFRYDAERAMAEVTFTCRTLIEILDQAEDDLLAISYESLVLRPTQALGALSAFLGIPLRAIDGDSGSSLFRRHGTSGDPRASVGRWISDMTPEEQAATREPWQEFLERFGYDQATGLERINIASEPLGHKPK